MQAVAPIKLGEYLLCGVPVVATAGIRDQGAISNDAGLLLQCMDESELQSTADWFVDSVLSQRERFRSSARLVGLSGFSLEASADSYQRALQDLVRESHEAFLMLTRYGQRGASSRMRFYQYKPWLETAGIDVTVSPFFSDGYVAGLQQGQKSLREVIAAYPKRMLALLKTQLFELGVD